MATLKERIHEEVSKIIVGKIEEIDLIIATIIAKGHVLLEGVPGVAKTLIARTIAGVLGLDFARIQFVPDLLPSDITGTMVYRNGRFEFEKGPVFTEILLADEINRAPPKTQAALLQAMQEKEVTVWGRTYPLPELFTVIATMNPIEFEGVYPLSEAQVDRFMVKVKIGYPTIEETVKIIDKLKHIEEFNINPVTSREELLNLREKIWTVHVDDNIKLYAALIAEESRKDPRVLLGASPRAVISMIQLSRAFAILEGRDYITPDDVKKSAYPTMIHRIILKPEARLSGVTPESIIKDVLEKVEPP